MRAPTPTRSTRAAWPPCIEPSGLEAGARFGALIVKGADPLLMNKSGSTALHLAVQNTGKSSSGSEAAKREQARIIRFLLVHGASPSDLDAKGKTVAAAATSEWIRELLDNG
jgi:ankyrin repeat protein